MVHVVREGFVNNLDECIILVKLVCERIKGLHTAFIMKRGASSSNVEKRFGVDNEQ